MSDTQLNVSVSDLRKEIITWLKTQLDSDGFQWISNQHKELSEGAEDWQFFSSFSAVPRHSGKENLKLSTKELDKADQIRSGWRPDILRVDQLGRILLVLSIAEIEKEEFLDKLEKTFVSADMGESVALYQALPILPYPEELKGRAAEGIRSNMTSVFNAVALHNPYPAEYFDEGAWNQLVLKALFVQTPLYQIQGLDQRANQKLADMLVDYAHERWAAGRTVSPELWRPVGPFAEGDMIEDLKKVLADEDPLQKQAAVLALAASDDKTAKALVEEHQQLLDEINSKNIDWNDIGERAEKYR
ncbi:EboA family metabolite traffic protein [Aliifodinibius sp. S!AR15-10]|uniref:EboA family metabolite traffic protein n=1 Tax=Aliifodinibius sp. S!AR15-10 TaxID=2950437 RepID=UPI00285B4E5D|nr:EboA family metabolite traffic protein [Aliifodinibius sp. S!AR15-10]MDR8391861.1 EboA family metabolite traffic protein [Aliifodinibius sp. S!AR15-10]